MYNPQLNSIPMTGQSLIIVINEINLNKKEIKPSLMETTTLVTASTELEQGLQTPQSTSATEAPADMLVDKTSAPLQQQLLSPISLPQ